MFFKLFVYFIFFGFMIFKVGDIFMVFIRVLMMELRFIKVIFIYGKKLKGICCELDDKVWVYGDDEEIK